MTILHRFAPPLLLIAIGLLVYWAGLHGGFVFDDFPNLVADQDWKVTSLDPSEWRRAIFHGDAGSFGRPLALLTFAVNHYFTGLDPFPLKLTGLAFHLFNGVLVYWLCLRLFALAPAARPGERMGPYAALLLAMAWLVHPLQVSSVLYVVQRMEVAAHTFVLLSLLAYLRGRSAQIQGRRYAGWLLLSALAMLLGLGFKESALLVPGYALVAELCVLRFHGAEGRASRFWITAYAVSAAVALLLYAFWFVPHYLSPETYAFRGFTLAQRLLTQLHVLPTYLGWSLVPLPAHLVFYYDNFPVSTGLFSPPATILGVLILLASLGTSIAVWRRWPLISLGIGWFFVAHALTSNVVPLELAFEHRNYFALLGVLIAVAQLTAWAGSRLHMDARRTMAALPVLLLALLCATHAHTWGNPFRLAMTLATRNPDSPRASYELGKLLLEQANSSPNTMQWAMARSEFEHAAALAGSPPLAEQALIVMYARTGQDVPAEVWESFRKKFASRPAGPQEELALHAVLECRIKRQCVFDDEQLFRTLMTVVQHNPQSAVLHSMYANFAYNVIGEPDLAIRMMREARRLEPGDAQYRINLAKYLAAAGINTPELDALVAGIRREDHDGRFRQELEQIESLRNAPKGAK